MGNPSENNQKSFDLNDLAIMVAKGFENTSTKDDVKRLENRMDGMENRMDGMEKSMKSLETGQEDIKLKLDWNLSGKYLLAAIPEIGLQTAHRNSP
ncbi:MAG: hypothetical protein Q8N81_05385 [bacterium]|nr:hypothetical protein [bacterium]